MRFDQPDPYGGSYDMTAPQSFNRYSYVQNDPVNFVDPLGLDPQDPTDPPPTTHIDPVTGQPTQVGGVNAGVVTINISGGDRGAGPGGTSTGPMEIELGPIGPTGAEIVPQNPVQQEGPCTFNINISGVSGEALIDMQNEITRIFASGGFNVVFNRPDLANAGSANLAVTDHFFGAIARRLSVNVNRPRVFGFTEGRDAQVNTSNIFTYVNGNSDQLLNAPPARPVLSSTDASYGTIFGRVGAHEAIAHALTGGQGHPPAVPYDVRSPNLSPRGLGERYNLMWNIGPDTAAALRAKCP